MPTFPGDLPHALDAATFHSLSLCRSGAEWQAGLQLLRGDNSFRIRAGQTPSEALAALFAPTPAAPVTAPSLPPLPY